MPKTRKALQSKYRQAYTNNSVVIIEGKIDIKLARAVNHDLETLKARSGQAEIVILIRDSPGGSPDAGSQIITGMDTVVSSGIKLTTIGFGQIHSAAVDILLKAKQCYLFDAALIHAHTASIDENITVAHIEKFTRYVVECMYQLYVAEKDNIEEAELPLLTKVGKHLKFPSSGRELANVTQQILAQGKGLPAGIVSMIQQEQQIRDSICKSRPIKPRELVELLYRDEQITATDALKAGLIDAVIHPGEKKTFLESRDGKHSDCPEKYWRFLAPTRLDSNK